VFGPADRDAGAAGVLARGGRSDRGGACAADDADSDAADEDDDGGDDGKASLSNFFSWRFELIVWFGIE